MILRRRRSRTLLVIPARRHSTRLSGKMLRLLDGVPVVEWTRRAAVRADCGPVVVATDHDDIQRAVERFGGTAVLTSARCRSGTDRVAQAAKIVESARGGRFRSVINLQGDEPFIRASTIRKVVSLLEKGRPDMTTAVVPLPSRRAAVDPDVVKAVVSADGRCLYFSRLPVPYDRHRGALPPLQHIGIYGFRRSALDRFVSLRPSALERCEGLEQLRALEAGMRIMAARVKDRPVGIDTPADLRRAAALLRARRRKARRV
ncbi:3-deoxy-manno-octulosonate cytidylyltransferase [Elusimicrobiota bacterium]